MFRFPRHPGEAPLKYRRYACVTCQMKKISSDSVHDLRRRWKPHKTRLSAGTDGHPTVIRFHRATTWLQRVKQIELGEDQDVALTCQWIAFNTLYGEWDERAREPMPDRQSWRAFMDRVLAIDKGGHLASMLTEHKRLVMSILDDSYLGDYFWKLPSAAKAKQTTRDKRQAATWYIEKRWALVLEALLDRIYFLRCQVVHGASSHGSRLNRTSLKRCIRGLGGDVLSADQVNCTLGSDVTIGRARMLGVSHYGIVCY